MTAWRHASRCAGLTSPDTNSKVITKTSFSTEWAQRGEVGKISRGTGGGGICGRVWGKRFMEGFQALTSAKAGRKPGLLEYTLKSEAGRVFTDTA